MPTTPWDTVDTVPTLDDGAVHVWQEPLDGDKHPHWLASLALSPADVGRAERFKVPARRHAFTLGRLLARRVVAHYLDRDAESVAIDVHENGKPFIITQAGEPAIDISLSHSSAVLLVAVSRAGAVGVDAEAIDPSVDHDAIARRFFAAAEVAALTALPGPERAAAFFRCWTRKEAVVKARGDGLARALNSFTVSVDAITETALRAAPAVWGTDDWHLHDLAPTAICAGALAVRGASRVVRRLRWMR